MKKLILALVVFIGFASFKAQAQVHIVNDPSILKQVMVLLEQSQEQMQKIKEQTQFLQKAEEQYSKINNNIKQVNLLQNVVKGQKEIYSEFNRLLKKVPSGSEIKSPKVHEAYLSNLNRSRRRIIDNNEYIIKLLSDNTLKMSDYERMQELKRVDKENKAILNYNREKEKEYEYINKNIDILNSLKSSK